MSAIKLMRWWAVACLAGAVLLLWFGCVNTPYGRRLFVPTLSTNAAGVVTTNFQVNPGVTNALGRARDITQAIPTPWSDIAATVLAGATGLLAWIAKVKSDRASLVPTLIAGIEASPNNESVKTTIKRIAEETGMEPRLNKAVRRVKSARARLDFGKTP